MNLSEKKTLVVGLGRSGIAAAKFLKNRNALVTVTDSADKSELAEQVSILEDLGVKLELGAHSAKVFEKADLIIISPGVPHTIEPIIEAKKRNIPVIGEFELATRFIKDPIVAVTGTNGKTTTTELISKMIENSGFKVFTGGNIGTPLIEYVNKGLKADIIVAEVSSFQLDTIDMFRPKVSVLLNITEDHLDRYPDFNAYAESKARVFENQQAQDIVVLNGLDPIIRRLSKNIKAQKLFFVGRKQDESGTDINDNSFSFYSKENPNFNIENPCKLLDLSKTKLVGKHNFENVSAAALAALAAGANIKSIQAALDNFQGLSHRVEYVATINGVKYYNDSKATNIDAVKRAIETFESNIILIMGGRDKDSNFSTLSNLVAKCVKNLILIGEAKEIIKSALENKVSISDVNSMEEAVFLAESLACSTDVVLLSPGCASFDMYNNYAHRGEIFCKAVEKLKYEKKRAKGCS